MSERAEAAKAWSVYLVRLADGALYTGIASDVPRRLGEHERGKGAKYLRGRGPLELVFEQRVGARAIALRVEARIKKLAKVEKEALVLRSHSIRGIVAAARESAR